MKRAEFTIMFGETKISGEVKYDLPPVRSIREVMQDRQDQRPASRGQHKRKPSHQVIAALKRLGYPLEQINEMSYDQAYRRAKGMMAKNKIRSTDKVTDKDRDKLLLLGYTEDEINKLTKSQGYKRARGITKFKIVKR